MQLSTWGFLKKIPVLWTKCKSSLETLSTQTFLRVAFDVPWKSCNFYAKIIFAFLKIVLFFKKKIGNVVKWDFLVIFKHGERCIWKTYFGLVFAECGNALTFEYPAELETLFGAGGEQKLVSASLSYIFVLEWWINSSLSLKLRKPSVRMSQQAHYVRTSFLNKRKAILIRYAY